ncbi:delta 8-(E)-sphingolipid desaturase [Rhypophila sp. PSN 637]
MDRDRILTPRMVEGMIAEGHVIVMYDGMVLRLDSWLEKHPGGRLAILHMVGKDATDEIKAYHSATTLRLFKAFRIGRQPAGRWHNTTPPIRGGVYRKLEASPSPSLSATVTDLEDEIVDDASTSSGSYLFDEPTRVASSVTSVSDCSSDVVSGDDKAGPSARISTTEMRKRTAFVSGSGAEEASTDEMLSKSVSQSEPPPNMSHLTKAEYTDYLMQQSIEKDLKIYPSVDPIVQEEISRKYRILHQKVQDGGFYQCPYVEYAKEMTRYSTLFACFIIFLRFEWYMTSAVFLGLFWHQIMFTAHDAGHRAITGKFVPDTLIGLFIADFCCGLSLGWWKSSHNVHHLITNDPASDPDIQNVPLFATSAEYFKSVVSNYYDNFVFYWDAVADVMVPYQAYTYYPIMGLARFNLYILSWCHVLSTRASSLGGSKAWWIRPTEVAFMACYWFIFGYCLVLRTLPTWPIRVAFVLLSHFITMPLHVQITLSHWGMSTANLGESESFPQRQLRTTMDVDCPKWLDFIHGGLQFQAVHHLFPCVPRHNLRKVQALVKEFCEETKIPYSLFSFYDGNKVVLSRLDEVAHQAKILLTCQKHMAETGESGLH